jgi:ATP-dependent Clp protease protease subunit
MLSEIVANNCNQPIEKVVQDMERDYWMDPYEAKEYGLIDKVFDIKGIL